MILKHMRSFNEEFFKRVTILDHKTEFAQSIVSFAGTFVFISRIIHT